MNNKVLKAGIWYTISNFLIKGLVLLTMPIFTRIMSETDIGLFSNINSWFNILAIITTFEIYSSISIARFDYKDDLDTYISSSLLLGTFITITFYIIVIIFHAYFERLFLMDFKTINIIFIYLMVYPAIQMFQLKNQIEYKYIPTIIVSGINAILSSVISIILTITVANKLVGRIYGYYIPLILVALIVYIYLLHKGKKISTKYWKYALVISFPLIWHLLAGYILSSADKVMITKIISPEANALYSVAYTISMAVSLLWSSMNNAWSPWAYEQMNKKNYNNLKEKSKPYTIFFIIIVFTLILIMPELLLIMGGKNYVQAKYVMPPVMIGYVFQFIYSLYVNIEFYHKKQKNIAIGTIIAAVVNIILNAIFIPKYGYIAAAYTTLFGYILLLIIHYLLVKRLNCTHWYDSKFFIKICFISLISIMIFNILYTINTIRYIIITLIALILLIIIIINRKKIMIAIKSKNINNLISILIFSKKGGKI